MEISNAPRGNRIGARSYRTGLNTPSEAVAWRVAAQQNIVKVHSAKRAFCCGLRELCQIDVLGTVHCLAPLCRALAEDDRHFVKMRQNVIHMASKEGKLSTTGFMLIGKCLTEVKERLLPYGSWIAWLKTELNWPEWPARKIMQVYDAFQSDDLSNLEIDIVVVYILARKPEPVRKEAIRRARNGERITRAKAIRLEKILKP